MTGLTTRRKAAAALAAAVCAAAMTVVGAGPASASQDRTVCKGGDIASGTYETLVITGYCVIPDDAKVVVKDNLVLKRGAVLNAVTLATVHVHGNVRVGHRAILGLGCTVIGVGCAADSDVRVGGNIVAFKPLTMFIDGVTVCGNVRSFGGGPGLDVTHDNIAFNYAFKDNTVHGNVRLMNWRGGWMGAIRNDVSGYVVYARNAGNDPDANEIVHNMVGGNLGCWGNSPAAQFGDAAEGAPPGYAQNVVGGRAKGQCAALV